AAGYNVRIVDAKWDTDWRREVRDRAKTLACVGVTSLTGPAVEDGLQFSAYVKSIAPEVPVVWGGWHASYAAQQAICHRCGAPARWFERRSLYRWLSGWRDGESGAHHGNPNTARCRNDHSWPNNGGIYRWR